MKKLILSALFAFVPTALMAHSDLRNASELTRGTIPNERIDKSSITALGPKIYTSDVFGVIAGTQVNPSSFTLMGSNIYTSHIVGGIASTQIIAGLSLSTGNGITELIISTNGADTNLVASSATAIDIMGCYYVNYSSYVRLNLAGAGGVPVGDGLDEANRTYSLWAISNNACTASGMIASTWLDLGRPKNMPGGFTKFRKIGYVRNDGSSNILPYFKKGNDVSFYTRQSLLNTGTVATARTALDASAIISTGATFMHGHFECIGNSAAQQSFMIKSGQNSTFGPNEFINGAATTRWGATFGLPLSNDPTRIDYLAVECETNIEINIYGYKENVP